MALEFDGTSQGRIISQVSGLPIYNNGEGGNKYSVCGWVKGNAQEDRRIYGERGNASANPMFAIGSGLTNTSKIRMYIRNNSGGAICEKESNTNVFNNSWHHFCWIDNNGTAELYIDGVKDETDFAYNRGTLTLDVSTIACLYRFDYFTSYFEGQIFDIRCYNRCLTANEIAEIYHKRGADKIWHGLVGRWRLDELSSGTPCPLLLDSMDSTTGWGTIDGSVSVNSSTYVQGSAALNMTKTNTEILWSHLYRNISSTNLLNQTIKLWVYIKDSTTLSKINRIALSLGKDFDNRFMKKFYDLSVGWNDLSAHIDDFEVFAGSPDKTNVTFISISLVTEDESYTVDVGDVIYDFYRAGNYPYSGSYQNIDLSGNGNHGTPYNFPTYQDSPHRLRRGVLIS